MGKPPAGPARFLRLHHIVVALVPALVVVLAITGFVWAHKGVTVVVDGDSRFIKTQADTVAAVLDQAGVVVGDGDVVSPPPASELEDGMTVVVRHAVPVTLVLGGTTLSIDVVGATVADALVAAGADPGAGLTVEPAIDAPLVSGMTITARNVFLRFEEEPVEIPFKVTTTQDATLPSGARAVITRGVAGKALRIFQVIVVDGVPGARTLKSETIVLAPVDEVVSVGTRRTSPRVSRARAAAPPAEGTRMTVTTTAYAPGTDGVDGRTATGARATYGIIAVDPRVIPLGTRIYVPGYGYGVAADTGGAIKGNKIDLCFDTRAEAMAWGRRTVTIIILP